MPQLQIPRDQHLLSKAILKGWADPTTGLLAWHSLQYGRSYRYSPEAIAKEPDFIRWNAVEMEGRWNLIENGIPELREAAPTGSGLLSARHMDMARQVLALHWARGLTAHELEKRMVPLAVALTKREMLRDQPDKLAAAFYQRYRIYPAGPEALGYYATHDLEISTSALEQSFANRVQENFDTATALLRNFGIQVWHAPPGTEFFLSDVGALTLDPAKPLCGPLWGVRWHDAKTIFMPLGPTVVIAAGDPLRREILPAEIVLDVNLRTVWSSIAHVAHRQDPVLEAWIREAWNRRPQLQEMAGEPAQAGG